MSQAGEQQAPEARFYSETGPALAVARLAEPVIEDMGYRLVRVRISGENGCTVQVMAERPDGTLNIDDCTEISRVLSPLFDVEEPVSGTYHLEVSSPGIDRPLVRASDFGRHAGEEAKLELKAPMAGRKRFRGRIEGAEGGEARIVVDLDEFEEPQVIGLPLNEIAEARIVFDPQPHKPGRAGKHRKKR
ncbi:MAG: ribosome maturation factor RimP [Hyphomicrobiales bacterium]|nr:MAG: ribosome maturation factor RimP [Hyphomicrobiales bacterium]